MTEVDKTAALRGIDRVKVELLGELRSRGGLSVTKLASAETFKLQPLAQPYTLDILRSLLDMGYVEYDPRINKFVAVGS